LTKSNVSFPLPVVEYRLIDIQELNPKNKQHITIFTKVFIKTNINLYGDNISFVLSNKGLYRISFFAT
jgi:hypothetical protein